jgi:hypothetical protein
MNENTNYNLIMTICVVMVYCITLPLLCFAKNSAGIISNFISLTTIVIVAICTGLAWYKKISWDVRGLYMALLLNYIIFTVIINTSAPIQYDIRLVSCRFFDFLTSYLSIKLISKY